MGNSDSLGGLFSGFLFGFVERFGVGTLEVLLVDRSSGGSVIWASSERECLGEGYGFSDPISVSAIVGGCGDVIRPGFYRAVVDRVQRAKKHAEVFTPVWLCNQMINMLDEEWFGRSNVFNCERSMGEYERSTGARVLEADGSHLGVLPDGLGDIKPEDAKTGARGGSSLSWVTNCQPVVFQTGGERDWRSFVSSLWLEIACGEAPFLCSRYDAVTGVVIPVSERVGVLDRKLRVVGENTESEELWVRWGLEAVKSVYGFEYQGDNLLLARVNVLETFVEHYEYRWGSQPPVEVIGEVAEVVSWNLWQMDGLTGMVPVEGVSVGSKVSLEYLSTPLPQWDTTGGSSIGSVESFNGGSGGGFGGLSGGLGEVGVEPVEQLSLFDFEQPDFEQPNQVGEPDEPEYADRGVELVAKGFVSCLVYDWSSGEVVEFSELRKQVSAGMKKFYAVIGNPPYQEETDSESTRMPPIYDKFMEQSYMVADKVELVTPARFLFNAGYTPKAWNRKMLDDEHLKVLKYEQVSGNVFPGTDIKGGIAVTYRDARKNFGPIRTFTVFSELNSILSKTLAKMRGGETSLAAITYPALSYKATDVMTEEHPELLHRMKSKADPNPKKLRLRTNAFDNLPELFFKQEPKVTDSSSSYIQILGLTSGKRTYRWIKRNYLDAPDNFESYKVILPAANGSGAIGEVLSTPLIGEPLIGYTRTFISIGRFDTREEAEACLKYVKSKFARTMLGVLKITQHNPPAKWKYVPLQDFTKDSDIDWSESVAGIDQQLYRKYGLSAEEIEFIETRVKEMN